MAQEAQLSRDELIGLFWDEVRKRLIEHHHRHRDEVYFGIGRYRSDTERLGIGDVVYNQGIERTAEVIDGVIDYGLPERQW